MRRYLGYSISADKLEAIAKEVDNDESGYISFQERQQVGAELLLSPMRMLKFRLTPSIFLSH